VLSYPLCVSVGSTIVVMFGDQCFGSTSCRYNPHQCMC